MANGPPTPAVIVRHCLRRRCPRCGGAPLFGRWLRIRHRCTACGLRYQEHAGDTWAFWILIERLFLGAVLLVIVLGFRSRTWASLLTFGGITLAVFFATMPHRLALCLGFDYLSRRLTGDLPDEGALSADLVSEKDNKVVDRSCAEITDVEPDED